MYQKRLPKPKGWGGGVGSNLQGISGSPRTKEEAEIISSLSSVSILHDGNPTHESCKVLSILMK